MFLRALLKLLAPLFYSVASRAFRSRWFSRSDRKQRWVMSAFRLAADIGHRDALSVYGHLLLLRGDSLQSKIQGGIYLERAAKMGEMKAQYQMARIYEEGFKPHFSIDQAKALNTYQQAAEQHHILAATRLAEAYKNGELGLQPDSQQAQHWQQMIVS